MTRTLGDAPDIFDGTTDASGVRLAAVPLSPNVDRTLLEIGESYVHSMPRRLLLLEAKLADLAAAPDDACLLASILFTAHQLRGSGATYGIPTLSAAAGLVEDELTLAATGADPPWGSLAAALASAARAVEKGLELFEADRPTSGIVVALGRDPLLRGLVVVAGREHDLGVRCFDDARAADIASPGPIDAVVVDVETAGAESDAGSLLGGAPLVTIGAANSATPNRALVSLSRSAAAEILGEVLARLAGAP